MSLLSPLRSLAKAACLTSWASSNWLLQTMAWLLDLLGWYLQQKKFLYLLVQTIAMQLYVYTAIAGHMYWILFSITFWLIELKALVTSTSSTASVSSSAKISDMACTARFTACMVSSAQLKITSTFQNLRFESKDDGFSNNSS